MYLQAKTLDLSPREKVRRDKQDYIKVRRAEIQYGVKLRKIARHVGEVITAFPIGDPRSLPEIRRILEDYAQLLTPWARVTAASMLADVKSRDDKVWAQMTQSMSEGLRHELERAPMGETFLKLQEQQVSLITSIPRKASERVHKLTYEALLDGTRANAIKQEIMRSGKVEESRATLIARTEVGRASTNLGQARALHVGSEGYIWRTARDMDVRKSHKAMEGRFVPWNKEPVLEGMRGHAGCLPNCRCWPEIVLPDEYLI